MTRLSISVAGDPLTFRPVTSSIVRQCKEGNINVVIMLFGSHYNIKMDGILQLDTEGDIDNNTVTVANSEVKLAMQRQVAGSGTAVQKATFSSFMYFYPGLKITGHLKLSETSHTPAVPELEGQYRFKDLLSNDELFFRLARDESNLRFECVELVSGTENVIYTENLAAGVDEVYFEFVYLESGLSKLYMFTNYALITQEKIRKWRGNLTARIGECNVTLINRNAEESIHTVSSDLIFLQYPNITLKFDRDSDDRFIGHVRAYDDNNSLVEADWSQVRSRDYKFVGNRIFENGMIRVIINTTNPTMEIWGWNFLAAIPNWEKVMDIIPDSDSEILPLKVQNVVISYFTKLQLKVQINFGTSIYEFIMSRGDPYITMLEKSKTTFKFKSTKSRFIGDMSLPLGGYTLANSVDSGNPNTLKANGTVTCASVLAADTVTVNGLVYTAVAGVKADNTEFSIDTSDTACAADLADSIVNDTRTPVSVPSIDVTATSASAVVTITSLAGGVVGNSIGLVSSNGTRLAVSGAGTLTGGAATGGTGIETITNMTHLDNWFGVYEKDNTEDLIGWISNMVNPTQIDIMDKTPDIEYKFTYPREGNIIALGVLPGNSGSLVGNTPTPFVVGTQDKYVKWPANEAVLAFKEVETIKRR